MSGCLGSPIDSGGSAHSSGNSGWEMGFPPIVGLILVKRRGVGWATENTGVGRSQRRWGSKKPEVVGGRSPSKTNPPKPTVEVTGIRCAKLSIASSDEDNPRCATTLSIRPGLEFESYLCHLSRVKGPIAMSSLDATECALIERVHEPPQLDAANASIAAARFNVLVLVYGSLRRFSGYPRNPSRLPLFGRTSSNLAGELDFISAHTTIPFRAESGVV